MRLQSREVVLKAAEVVRKVSRVCAWDILAALLLVTGIDLWKEVGDVPEVRHCLSGGDAELRIVKGSSLSRTSPFQYCADREPRCNEVYQGKRVVVLQREEGNS